MELVGGGGGRNPPPFVFLETDLMHRDALLDCCVVAFCLVTRKPERYEEPWGPASPWKQESNFLKAPRYNCGGGWVARPTLVMSSC